MTKFLNEVTPVLDKAQGDFVNKLSTEAVESFNYVRYCWYESMRL